MDVQSTGAAQVIIGLLYTISTEDQLFILSVYKAILSPITFIITVKQFTITIPVSRIFRIASVFHGMLGMAVTADKFSVGFFPYCSLRRSRQGFIVSAASFANHNGIANAECIVCCQGTCRQQTQCQDDAEQQCA